MGTERKGEQKGPKRDRADAPVRDDEATADLTQKTVLDYQRRAGNAATTGLLQRFDEGTGGVSSPPPSPWVKGVIPGTEKQAPPQPWVKGVVPGTEKQAPPQPWVKGVVPGTEKQAPPPPWAKATPKGAPGAPLLGKHPAPRPAWSKTAPSPNLVPTGGKGLGPQRDPAMLLAQASLHKAAEAAKSASQAAAQAAAQAVGGEQTATASATRVNDLKRAAGVRLATAKGFWPSDEPFAGAQAAKQAEAVDVLQGEGVTKVGEAATAEQTASKADLAAAAAAGTARAAKGLAGTAATTLGGLASKELLAAVDRDTLAAEEAETKAALAAKAATVQHGTAKVTQADVDKSQTDVWQPMKIGGGPAVIIGRLQQQLNATRQPGAARVSITGAFTAPTESLLKAFQAAPTGVADSATWNGLDKKAPAVRQAGEWVIHSQEGDKTMGTPWKGNKWFEGLNHPFIVPKVTDDGWYAVDKGPAVKELQQRLNNWVRPKMVRLVVDGVYGRKTQAAVQEFQVAKGVPKGTTVDKATWNALDALAGPVSTGLVQHNEMTEVEGQERGQTIRYAWKVTGSELQISVRMKFVHADPYAYDLLEPLKKDPRNPKKYASSEISKLQRRMSSAQSKWISDITRVWNGFSAKDAAPKSANRPMRVVFQPIPVSSGEDATIEIIPGAHAENDSGRSDSAHWFASDEDAGLAPHEFGHLIGLPDEYSRREEAQAATTGTEPNIGDVEATTADTPLELAQDLAVPGRDVGDRSLT